MDEGKSVDTYPCVFCHEQTDQFLSYGGCDCPDHIKFPLCRNCELMMSYMAQRHLGLDARYWRMFSYEEVMAMYPNEGEPLVEGAEEAALAEVERILRGEE